MSRLFLLPLLVACKKDVEDTQSTDPGDTSDSGQIVPTCADGTPVRDFQDAEADDSLYAIAADFTLDTLAGSWSFSENWTGCDNYLFIQDEPNQAGGWPTPLWDRDHEDLLELLPDNTHVFFVSSQGSETDRLAAIEGMKADMDAAILAVFPEEEHADWQGRLHYATERDWYLPSWLGDIMQYPGWGAGIDRLQRVRYIGSYADPYRYSSSAGWFEPNLRMAANEAVHYNFEAVREAELETDGADVVTIFEEDLCSGNVYVDATLPDAETMATYDSMTIDLYMGCDGEGEFGTCPAWDYMAYLYMCDRPDVSDNPYSDEACQPYIAEVLGSCQYAGETSETQCREATDCDDGTKTTWTCEGYEAAIDADTHTGFCQEPGADNVEALYTCNEDGTGYGDIACDCNTEVGRWITTYHREGRYVYDNSAMLPYLSDGGTWTFRFNTTGPYVLDMDFRMSNQGKDAQPTALEYLFSGGTLNIDYNTNHEDVTIFIPEAAKVELATVISQHGADGNNCGEFCDVSHHFTINGDEANEIIRDFPEASSAFDCMDQVADGTVPNQYGTWWYGRAGWCPGKEVDTVLHDITDQVTTNADNTFAYRALYQGEEYTGSATIRMHSWIVISQ